MSADQIAHLIAVVMTSLYGYIRLERRFSPRFDKLEHALEGKIGAREHAAKMNDLYGIINEQGRVIAVQADRLRRLEEVRAT